MVNIIPLWLIHIIALSILTIASITDLKKREVPDILNYSLIAIGVILGVINSIFAHTIWPFIASIIGVLLGYFIGAAMFYSGQWGGGDAKMLMGLGALLGFDIYILIEKGLFSIADSLFVNIFIATLIAGVIYGLNFFIFLIIKNRKKFFKYVKLKLRTKQTLKQRWFVIMSVILGLTIAFFTTNPLNKIIIISLSGFIFITYYGLIFMKIGEKYLLTGPMKIRDITPGEWLSKDLFRKGKEQSPVKTIKQNMALYYIKKGPQTAKKKRIFVNKKTKALIKKIVLEIYATGSFKTIKILLLKLNRKKYDEFRKKVIFALHLEKESSFNIYCKKNDLIKLKEVLKQNHIVFNKRFISGPKDLGINEEQIKLLKKLKTRTILVKKGIPFIPAFLLGYILVLVLINYGTTPLKIIASLV